MAERGLTRRALAVRSLGTAAAVGGGPALAALASPALAPAQTADDALISSAIGLESTLITIYAVGARSSRLDRDQRRLAARFGTHSREHVRALAERLSELGAAPAPPKPNEISGLAGASARGYLNLALGFENQAYLALLDAITALSSAETRTLAASIAASTAQHLALLREELGRLPVTGAFETGA